MTPEKNAYGDAVDAAIRAANRCMILGFRSDLVLALFDALHEVNVMRPDFIDLTGPELEEINTRAAGLNS